MLSRVADNVYWLARYVERAENLARLVEVNASLMLDLPRELAPGWQSLITITGSQERFDELGKSTSERDIIRFLLAEPDNQGSMVSALAQARELARTLREILPREVWEHLNGLALYVNERANDAVDKRTRHGFLRYVILATQSLTGMLEGIVSEGPALWFMALGRNIERADMTSRIVDVRALGMLPAQGSAMGPFATIQWMSVLRSLSGYQMYRIKTGQRVYPAGVVSYLLADTDFPRACVCCLRRAQEVLLRLPNSQSLVSRVQQLRDGIAATSFELLDGDAVHQYIDQLQLSLAAIHDDIRQTYFLAGLAAVHPGAGESQSQA
ncbi:MAG: alpha-E domain-containing protein [Proteobacteria bacterium]|nr:alpha-E domain-containing protein [Pseudomonadota bacterium]